MLSKSVVALEKNLRRRLQTELAKNVSIRVCVIQCQGQLFEKKSHLCNVQRQPLVVKKESRRWKKSAHIALTLPNRNTSHHLSLYFVILIQLGHETVYRELQVLYCSRNGKFFVSLRFTGVNYSTNTQMECPLLCHLGGLLQYEGGT